MLSMCTNTGTEKHRTGLGLAASLPTFEHVTSLGRPVIVNSHRHVAVDLI